MRSTYVSTLGLLKRDECGYLSRSDGTLQRSLLLRQVRVNFSHPRQGGAVPVKMRLLLRWVEEPALCEQKKIL